MNLLNRKRMGILSDQALHAMGALMLLAGAVGGVIQKSVLDVGGISNAELFERMQSDPTVMGLATAALICQLLEVCAVPVFSFLLVEGVVHTSRFARYFLRVAGLAAVCQFLWSGSLNILFGPVLGLVMLWFFRRYAQKTLSHRLIRIFAVTGTLLWSVLLGVEHGPAFLLLTAAQWALRSKLWFRTFGGFLAAMACSVFSPLYMASPLAFLILYFYDEERGGGIKAVNYAVYPLVLLVCRTLEGLAA